MDAAALLAHIVSQTEQNIKFLIAQNQISAADGRDILQKLPVAKPTTAPTPDALVQQTQSLAISTPAPSLITPAAYTPSPVSSTPYQSPPPPHAPAGPHVLFRAKATWDYNVNNQDPNDLTFRAGDTIDIIAETNPDWWTGTLHGKQGLFPSNYVEKIPGSAAPPPPPQSAYTSPPPTSTPYGPPASTPYGASATTPYGPQGSMEKVSSPPGYPSYGYQPPSGYQGPPPQGQGYLPYSSAPPPMGPTPQPESQSPAEQQPKKSKFGGKFGSTLAHSAVGGVGFGAGSAVGSGLIHSIF
ncbi:Class E vacuolar protein-sorting machinery protein HSE1 [Hypsizygus marmoreus]|uniref:Class E vacuolar protein-sorting machinery protein HSE1 n=1 Tax=Hypsizygus marmoreus TaxID=39966 RepID=A0A369JA98_HYPMA|nr:Class E vacuolar protein-sorting machinery protein HSE1 [Hypsizygus marmoreus]